MEHGSHPHPPPPAPTLPLLRDSESAMQHLFSSVSWVVYYCLRSRSGPVGLSLSDIWVFRLFSWYVYRAASLTPVRSIQYHSQAADRKRNLFCVGGGCRCYLLSSGVSGHCIVSTGSFQRFLRGKPAVKMLSNLAYHNRKSR